jgi:hypothetical protein
MPANEAVIKSPEGGKGKAAVPSRVLRDAASGGSSQETSDMEIGLS